jgi:hypothetical protein
MSLEPGELVHVPETFNLPCWRWIVSVIRKTCPSVGWNTNGRPWGWELDVEKHVFPSKFRNVSYLKTLDSVLHLDTNVTHTRPRTWLHNTLPSAESSLYILLCISHSDDDLSESCQLCITREHTGSSGRCHGSIRANREALWGIAGSSAWRHVI